MSIEVWVWLVWDLHLSAEVLMKKSHQESRGRARSHAAPTNLASRIGNQPRFFSAWPQNQLEPRCSLGSTQAERLQLNSTRVYLSLTQVLLNIHRSTIRGKSEDFLSDGTSHASRGPFPLPPSAPSLGGPHHRRPCRGQQGSRSLHRDGS